MLTNAAPRPWVPGCPVRLQGLSTDGKPTEWGGKPVANGSTLREMDTGAIYSFDQAGRVWRKWPTASGSGSSSGDGLSIATDEAVDSALDDVFGGD